MKFKNYYVIQHPSGKIIPQSLESGRKRCIESWLGSIIPWEEAKNIGWKCLKINVHFEILKK